MSQARWVLVFLGAWSLTGCGSSYEVGDPNDTGPEVPADSGGYDLLDAATLPPGDDAGPSVDDADVPSVRVDAAIPNDEPDVPPDARPSDDPSAAGWIDPPVLGVDQDCCTASPTVQLANDDEDQHDSGGLVVWTGRDYAAVWQGSNGPVLRHLDRSAQPITARRELDATAVAAIGWGHHQLAAVTSTPAMTPSAITFFDRDGDWLGTAQSAPSPILASVTRHAAVHGWMSVGTLYEETAAAQYHRYLVSVVDGQPPAAMLLGRAEGYGQGRAVVVSVASRLVSVEPSQTATVVRAFANAALTPSTPFTLDLGNDSSAARLRDTVMIIARPLGHAAETLVFDPFTNTMIGAPTTLDWTDDYFELAGDDIGGTVGVCFRDGDALQFELLGPDGARIGRAINLASVDMYASCAIASGAQDEFLVLWASASVVAGNIHATVVHVNR